VESAQKSGWLREFVRQAWERVFRFR